MPNLNFLAVIRTVGDSLRLCCQLGDGIGLALEIRHIGDVFRNRLTLQIVVVEGGKRLVVLKSDKFHQFISGIRNCHHVDDFLIGAFFSALHLLVRILFAVPINRSVLVAVLIRVHINRDHVNFGVVRFVRRQSRHHHRRGQDRRKEKQDCRKSDSVCCSVSSLHDLPLPYLQNFAARVVDRDNGFT